MGIYSDVGFAVKKSLIAELDEKHPWVRKESNVDECEIGTLFHFQNVKWYDDDEEIKSLIHWLNQQDDEDYILIIACHDYPDDTSADMGAWVEDPWNVHRECRVSIEFEPVFDIKQKKPRSKNGRAK
jgi:hypothetical protein